MPDRPETDIVHDVARSRYEATVMDAAGTAQFAGMLRYVRDGNVLQIPSTVVMPEFRRHGVASALTRRALDDARAAGDTVLPHCWYVDGWIERHREYDDLRWRPSDRDATMER